VVSDQVSILYNNTSYNTHGTKKRLQHNSKKRRQIICGIKIRHRRRHDSMDFVPLLKRAVSIVPIYTAVADRGYDSEYNHVAAQSIGIVNTIIRPKYENLQVYRTRGYNRKMMKFRFDWDAYHQRSKVETIFSVIKRMLGEYIMSRNTVTQNRETMYRMMAYNCYRITRNHLVILYGFYRANVYNFVYIRIGISISRLQFQVFQNYLVSYLDYSPCLCYQVSSQQRGYVSGNCIHGNACLFFQAARIQDSIFSDLNLLGGYTTVLYSRIKS